MPLEDESSQPLLREDEDAGSVDEPSTSTFHSQYTQSRQRLQRFLSTKTQHYCVLGLVALDVSCIFADIFINLYTCEKKNTNAKWEHARDGLAIAGLVFSCLFMLELAMSIWAFGWRYFQSWFHCFDGTVIVAGFVIDVLLHGALEEVASLVVILRLWRFFKIIEEFSVGAQEQMDGLQERIESLEMENEALKRDKKRWDEEQGQLTS